MKKRLFSILLVFAMLVSVLTACDEPQKNDESEEMWSSFDLNGEQTGYVVAEARNGSGDRGWVTSAKIPSTYKDKPVVGIGNLAFLDCYNLESVTIPESVMSIGNNAFGGCDSLTSIVVSDQSPYYASINGNLYSKDKKTLVQYAVGKKDTFFSIPENVTSIGDYAFSSCNSLTNIIIPEGVTSIGNSAFSNCRALTSITIPEGVTSIGDSVFLYCSNLADVIIPRSMMSIGNAALYQCDSLNTVYYGGMESEWNKILIDDLNSGLDSATIYYYSETEPAESGNYWHYDADGNPVAW